MVCGKLYEQSKGLDMKEFSHGKEIGCFLEIFLMILN
jgi:hypothetical protein